MIRAIAKLSEITGAAPLTALCSAACPLFRAQRFLLRLRSRDGPQGTVPAYPKIGPRYGHCGEYFCIHLPSLSNIVVSGAARQVLVRLRTQSRYVITNSNKRASVALHAYASNQPVTVAQTFVIVSTARPSTRSRTHSSSAIVIGCPAC